MTGYEGREQVVQDGLEAVRIVRGEGVEGIGGRDRSTEASELEDTRSIEASARFPTLITAYR